MFFSVELYVVILSKFIVVHHEDLVDFIEEVVVAFGGLVEVIVAFVLFKERVDVDLAFGVVLLKAFREVERFSSFSFTVEFFFGVEHHCAVSFHALKVSGEVFSSCSLDLRSFWTCVALGI